MHPHSYATRTRKHPSLRPSLRLPPSPSPRSIRPLPPLQPPVSSPHPCLPLFPVPGVMLHPDDAANKVFHAIGRSFLSVENRAMTIKDLAEMTLNHGLMCQNVSAASQAITTYIRNHMARCEAQQDHPLLVRHVLSGTLADDELAPALYSRVGGAAIPTKSSAKDLGLGDKNVTQLPPSTPEGGRLTNFRRGTMVWYLSKAAGVSCPFARAGIRLCEYGKEGKKIAGKHGDEPLLGRRKHANHDEAQCGEKRKRLRRGCRRDSGGSRESAVTGEDSESPAIDSGYGELGADSSDEEPPPKVKLTLRLRPSLPMPAAASRPTEIIDLSNDMASSSSEDEVSCDDRDRVDACLDFPCPSWSRSISAPCHTPTCDERLELSAFSPQSCVVLDERRHSCSASPPPDSDNDDFDPDLDSDIDWDSSSHSLPSPALQAKVEATDDLRAFKSEPVDIRDMLDAWEDLDCAPTSTVSSATVKLPSTTDDFKFDTLELWEWEFESGWISATDEHQDLPVVKMEPLDENERLSSSRAFAPGFSAARHSPRTPASRHSSSSPSFESDVGSTFQSPLSPFAAPSPCPIGNNCVLTWQDAELLGPDSVHPREFEDGWTSGLRVHVSCNSLQQHPSDEAASSSSYEPGQDEVDATLPVVKETGTCRESRAGVLHSSSAIVALDTVVVRTCRPCILDVCATQIEGISVYRIMLGSVLLLRRIDTDFVNLSTILSHLSLSPPSPLPTACVNVSHPSLVIDGIWAPLKVARMYSHGLPNGVESIFLSDDLVMHFPTALQDFCQKNTLGRSLNQFGPNFNTSLCWRGADRSSDELQRDHGELAVQDGWKDSTSAGLEELLLAIPPSVNRALAALHPQPSTEEDVGSPEVPLSPTEQEIFRALCVHPDWETEEAGTTGSAGKPDAVARHSSPRGRPLRRSRRVADAIAARTRVVPPRTKGPRHT